ncbi:hypothetical protein BGW80DRAFT_1147773, partial [Lactifluus volemus]
GVSAQDLNPCILNCLTSAATGTPCTTIQDTGCVCTNADFQNAAVSCLEIQCTTQDLQTAFQFQQSMCGSTTTSMYLFPTLFQLV